jgi:hypothetical protein
VIAEDGTVLESELVSEAGKDGNGVYFVRAHDRAQATRLASRSHEAEVLRARRARYAKEGKCRCGRERDLPDAKTCSSCRRQSLDAQERSDRRKRGEVVPSPDRRTAIAARRESERADLRVEVLNEVLSASRRKRSIEALREWIWSEIKKVTGRKEVA